jgi:hypothetical protein
LIVSTTAAKCNMTARSGASGKVVGTPVGGGCQPARGSGQP